jgi:DNA-binding MarR family transcriptional regulator
MHESFTPDEELVMLFLKKHPRSTASEIAMHTGLKHRGVLTRALEGLNAKGVLRHTDDRDERYYTIHAGHEYDGND